MPAGLPSWDDLVTELAERAGFTDPQALSDLGSLDAAEVLRRTLEKSEARKPAEEVGRTRSDMPWRVSSGNRLGTD